MHIRVYASVLCRENSTSCIVAQQKAADWTGVPKDKKERINGQRGTEDGPRLEKEKPECFEYGPDLFEFVVPPPWFLRRGAWLTKPICRL